MLGFGCIVLGYKPLAYLVLSMIEGLEIELLRMMACLSEGRPNIPSGPCCANLGYNSSPQILNPKP